MSQQNPFHIPNPADAGSCPTSATMHHAKALGHAEAAHRENPQIAQALREGQYGQAATLTADMLEHRALQLGEEVAAATRTVVGGSSVKPGDSVWPGYCQTGTTGTTMSDSAGNMAASASGMASSAASQVQQTASQAGQTARSMMGQASGSTGQGSMGSQ